MEMDNKFNSLWISWEATWYNNSRRGETEIKQKRETTDCFRLIILYKGIVMFLGNPVNQVSNPSDFHAPKSSIFSRGKNINYAIFKLK
jgi:hypothetical protein